MRFRRTAFGMRNFLGSRRGGIVAIVTVSALVAVTLAWNTATATPSRLATGSVPAIGGASPAARNANAGPAPTTRSKSPGNGAPSSAPAKPVTVTAPHFQLDQVGDSIAYLEHTYGVSGDEALRRLRLQAEAGAIDTQLSRALPGSYGGVWLDQTDGGLLQVAATDTAQVAAALRNLPDAAHIRVVPVARSLAQLNALQSSVRSQVPETKGDVTTDVTTNQVIVYQRSGGAAAGQNSATMQSYDQAERTVAAPDPQLLALVKATPGTVLRQMLIGEERSGSSGAPQTACSPQSCRPPLRGGMRLDIKRTSANNDADNLDPMWGQCTVGFIVYDSASQKFYALTAGHCLIGSDKTGINHAYNDSGTEIGYEVTAYQNPAALYPNDYALLTIPNMAYWLGQGMARNGVDVYCTNVESVGCARRSIHITGAVSYSSSHVGDVVCAAGSGNNDASHGGYKSSGAVPGTRCGEVTGANGGYVTNICSRKGDSGGPLFSEVTGQAYGILNDGTPGSGDCPSGNTEWSQYSPVDKIMTALNAGSSGNFAIRTQP